MLSFSSPLIYFAVYIAQPIENLKSKQVTSIKYSPRNEKFKYTGPNQILEFIFIVLNKN